MSDAPHHTDDLGFAVVDLDRERRQGLPEIVYGPGKTTDEIVAIATSLLAHCEGPVLVSRLEPDAADDVLARVRQGADDHATPGRLRRGCAGSRVAGPPGGRRPPRRRQRRHLRRPRGP